MRSVWETIERHVRRLAGWLTFVIGSLVAVGALLSPLPDSLKNFGVSMALLGAFAAPNAWVAQKASDPNGNWRERGGLVEFMTFLPLMLGASYALGTLAASSYVGALHGLVQFFTVSFVYTVLSNPVFIRLATGGRDRMAQPIDAPQPTKRDRKFLWLAFGAVFAFAFTWYGAFMVILLGHHHVSQTWATIILVGQMMTNLMQLALLTSIWLAWPSSWRELTLPKLWATWKMERRASGPDTWKRVWNAGATALFFRLGSLLLGMLGSGPVGVLLVELAGNTLFLPITYVVSRNSENGESPLALIRRKVGALTGRAPSQGERL